MDLNTIFSLMLMVHTVTGMPMPDRMPVFVNPTKEEVKNDQLGDTLPGGKWAAYTDMNTGEIAFRKPPNLKDVDDYCKVAHELTHYFQWYYQVRPRVPSHLEPQAYEVHAICYEKNKDPDGARWARIQQTKYILTDE